jgi:hypothetical protein
VFCPRASKNQTTIVFVIQVPAGAADGDLMAIGSNPRGEPRHFTAA